MINIIPPQFPRFLKATIAIALCATPAISTFATDSTKPEKPDEAAMMAAMAQNAQPGKNHKILEENVGSWSYKVKFWPGSDTNTPPVISEGTTVTKAELDGRFFSSVHKSKMQMPGPDGKMMDTDFKGMALEGYDNVKQKFVSTWIDSMGTGIMISEGSYDKDAKKLTYLSEYEPIAGVKIKTRQTVAYTDKDHHTMEFFENRGGSEVKTMEINYTRSK